jgi:hypothetical protein
VLSDTLVPRTHLADSRDHLRLLSSPVAARLGRVFRLVFLVLVYHLTASYVLQSFMQRHAFRGDLPRYGLELVVNGNADRPVAYRVLSPFIVREVSEVLAKVADPSRLLGSSAVTRYAAPNETWTPIKALHFHVAYVLTYLSLIGVLIAARWILAMGGIGRPTLRDIAPPLALLFIPFTYVHGAYIYDAPELLFLLLCTGFAMRGRWTWYYALLPLAILNKESNLFLGASAVALAAPSLASRDVLRPLIKHGALHAIIGFPIVLLVRSAVAGNPGSGAEFWFPSNVHFWLDPRSYFRFESGPAPLIPVPAGANVIVMTLAVSGIFAYWSRKPAWLKRLLLGSALVQLPLMLLFCFHDELRNLSLLFPAFFLAACHTYAYVNDTTNQIGTGTEIDRHAGNMSYYRPEAAPLV